MELYKQFRPDTFDKVVGNRAVVGSLKNSVAQGEVPHTILFSGPSGCGKTTLARILARELGCAPQDYNETNSANFRGIDSAREIITQMAYAPSGGKCRVWVMDECHKITDDAWNALLKPMEDTPDHVYFFLCTTNPEKLPKTIRTRCQPHDVQALSPEDIGKGILIPVCKARGIRPPMEILKLIATECMGSSRVALQTLEKVAGLPEDQMAEAAKTMISRESQVNQLCQLLLKKSKDWSEMATIIKGLTEEPESIRRAVLGYMNVVLLNSGNSRAYGIAGCFEKDYFTTGKTGLTMSCFDAMFGLG